MVRMIPLFSVRLAVKALIKNTFVPLIKVKANVLWAEKTYGQVKREDALPIM